MSSRGLNDLKMDCSHKIRFWGSSSMVGIHGGGDDEYVYGVYGYGFLGFDRLHPIDLRNADGGGQG